MKTRKFTHGVFIALRGENHPRAKICDKDVELLRVLHEQHGLGYKPLAAKFEISVRQVRDICHYRRR